MGRFATGDRNLMPKFDIYTITAHTDREGILPGIRLEALARSFDG